MTQSNRLPVLASEIRQAHADVQEAAKTAAQRAIDAGHALIEAKSLCQHGHWLPWLRESCALAERTAQLYMRIAKSGLESATVADLGLQAAAKTLLLPYPFADPFCEGEDAIQRDWWLFCLYLVIKQNCRCESAWNHIYWIRRKDFETPDEWLTDGPAFMSRVGCKMDERHLELWREFRADREGQTRSEIEIELERLVQAEPAEPVRKRRRRRA